MLILNNIGKFSVQVVLLSALLLSLHIVVWYIRLLSGPVQRLFCLVLTFQWFETRDMQGSSSGSSRSILKWLHLYYCLHAPQQYLCVLDIWLATIMLMIGNEVRVIEEIWFAWKYKCFGNCNRKHLEVWTDSSTLSLLYKGWLDMRVGMKNL